MMSVSRSRPSLPIQRRRRPLRGLVVAALASVLAGCDPSLMMSGASVVSLVATDKTLSDHAVSLATGRNCSTVRMSRGESFCAPEPHAMAAEHCYRTLGGISCYTRPDPQASDGAFVADVPAFDTRPTLDLGGFELPLPEGLPGSAGDPADTDDAPAGEPAPGPAGKAAGDAAGDAAASALTRAAPHRAALDGPPDFGDTAAVSRK
jgi:hypothetical protein